MMSKYFLSILFFGKSSLSFFVSFAKLSMGFVSESSDIKKPLNTAGFSPPYSVAFTLHFSALT